MAFSLLYLVVLLLRPQIPINKDNRDTDLDRPEVSALH